MNRIHCLYKHRWQVLNWAIARWPMDKARLTKMTKKQLFAIYNNTK